MGLRTTTRSMSSIARASNPVLAKTSATKPIISALLGAIDTAFSFNLERYEVEPGYFGKATGPRPSFEGIQFELERGKFNAIYVTMGVWENALSGNVDTEWEHLFPDSGSVAVGLR